MKHGSSWMWSLWPPLVGLINHIITEAEIGLHATVAWSTIRGLNVFSSYYASSQKTFKNILKNPSSVRLSIALRVSCPASRHVSQVFIYDTKTGRCWCLGPVNRLIMIFFICGSCLKTKGPDVTVTEPSVWTGTNAGAFFHHVTGT